MACGYSPAQKGYFCTTPKIYLFGRCAKTPNYEMMLEDEGYVSETSRLLWQLPCYGSCFRKTYRDPVLNKNVGLYVAAEDLIAPGEATGLATSPRFTHRMRNFKGEVDRLQLGSVRNTCKKL